jgi:DNA-binding transcriptional regulator YhcF (GntR family)
MWLSVNEQDSQPIYQQIIAQVRRQVASGAVKPEDELPSVRELADTLGVNMHTVRAAYLKLRDQGVINLRLGRRARIAALPSPGEAGGWQGQLDAAVTDALLSGAAADDIRRAVEKQLNPGINKEG